MDWNYLNAPARSGRKSHTLYGCVDWNSVCTHLRWWGDSHTLYGCVDWNKSDGLQLRTIKVTPCMGVWIETRVTVCSFGQLKSHPVWVCGLKQHKCWISWSISRSHPVWVCGLKLPYPRCRCTACCHTLYGCVDWNSSFLIWAICSNASHPVWVCGLKLVIENNTAYSRMSHPVWVCGLKLVHLVYTAKLPRHTLYGCVDWNIKDWDTKEQAIGHTLYGCVDWNCCPTVLPSKEWCHTLYGCVDWNMLQLNIVFVCIVTPCMGVWIETHQPQSL